MAIEFLCPRCQTAFQVADDEAGTKKRCPQCHAEVRVPFPEPHAPASLPIYGPVIEFLCPRCQTTMQATAAATGSKLRCPHCGGKVRVPTPRLALPGLAAERHNSPASDPPSPVPRMPFPESPVIEPLAALAARSHADIPWTQSRQRRPINPLGVLVPAVCVALIGGVLAWLLQKATPKLEGTLPGERLIDVELGPFRIKNDSLGRSRREAQAVFERLEAKPIRATGPLLSIEFKGVTTGINSGRIDLSLRCTDRAEFYRVDPRNDKLLSKYLAEHQDEFKTAVQNELAKSLPEFLAAVEKRGNQTPGLPGLAEFRDSVGLASLVTGFGFSVQAAIGKQTFPCVLEDREGRLYFALPIETEQFEVVGRERGAKFSRGGPRFSGRYSVHVSKTSATVYPEAPESKEKIRKLLKK